MKTILQHFNIRNTFLAFAAYSLIFVGSVSATSDASTTIVSCDELSNAIANSTKGDAFVLEGGCDSYGAPTSKEECKEGKWIVYNTYGFKNQGDCINYFKENSYEDTPWE